MEGRRELARMGMEGNKHMNEIKLVGQAITSTNYATARIFNFDPEHVRDVGINFLAAGIPDIEVPDGVLDPDGKSKDKGVDEEAVRKSLALLPKETKVVGTYIGPNQIGKNNEFFLTAMRQRMDLLVKFFPHLVYAMIHPPAMKEIDEAGVKSVVKTWAEAAHYAASKKPEFQFCLHNHYDTCCETAPQVRMFLDALGEINEPALRWGPDTGHCHGMNDEYLTIFEKYASLIGNHFHIKTRVAAFDQLHGGDKYRADRDIWGNKAEFGRGLYSGFVNCADPEIETPLKEVFAIIKAKARPVAKYITGAIEIDVPRQHPRLEAMCAALYLKQVHGLSGRAMQSVEQIVTGAFAGR